MIEEAKAVAQRLRDYDKYRGQKMVCTEAADTIDALVQEIERMERLEQNHIDRLLRIEQKVDVLIAERDQLRAEIERLKAKEERYTLVDTALKNEVEEMRQEVERLKQACDKFSESEMLLKQEQAEPVPQFRKVGCADWYDGFPDHSDGGGPYEVRTLYTAPQGQTAKGDKK